MDDVIAEYPLRDGGTWKLTVSQFRALRKAYGDESSPSWVKRELKKAHLWLLANPRRQKTGDGMMRFIVGWLNKAHAERGGMPVRVRRGQPVGISDILRGMMR